MSPAEPGLTVQVRFALADEQAARSLAAQLIDRAHQLANLPECECDLDVELRWDAPEPLQGPGPPVPAPQPRSDR